MGVFFSTSPFFHQTKVKVLTNQKNHVFETSGGNECVQDPTIVTVACFDQPFLISKE